MTSSYKKIVLSTSTERRDVDAFRRLPRPRFPPIRRPVCLLTVPPTEELLLLTAGCSSSVDVSAATICKSLSP